MDGEDWDAFSETDRRIFYSLSNSEYLNQTLMRDTPRVEELPCITEEPPVTAVVAPEPVLPPKDAGASQPHRIPSPVTAAVIPQATAPAPTLPPAPEQTPSSPPPPPRIPSPVQPPPPPAELPLPRAPSPVKDPSLLTKESIFYEKQSVLYDLQQLENRGVQLTHKWSMEDSLDDMTMELKRQLIILDERDNVSMLKNGLRMALTGIEVFNTRYNLLDLEGWSSQACAQLDRHDGNLARIYRKYWRRSSSNSPEMDIAMAVVGSMAVHHMQRSMTRYMMQRNDGTKASQYTQRRPPSPDSSDDEEVPPKT